ncbi:MAG TPA: helix-turn-helix transcriptional regulator [Mycobacteriales bacterium]|nr:helix-turn-helix transcriptional regulator [Mycobacteriales bacterium]
MSTSRNAALAHLLHLAGHTPRSLAERIGVDEKTVQRWLAGTTTPYARHRYAAARLLGVEPADLWPAETTGSCDSDLVTLYDSRLDIPDDVWATTIGAPGSVDILANDLTWLAESQPLLLAELACNALIGATITVALLDPEHVDTTSDVGALDAAARSRRSLHDLDPLLDIDRAIHSQVRVHGATPVTIYRFGRQMFVQPVLPGLSDSLAPVQHLERKTDAGPFDRYLAYLRHIWQQATPVPKHRRDAPSSGLQLIPPELAGEEGARADAFRARARVDIRRIVLNLSDESMSVLYDLGPELTQLLMPAVAARGRRRPPAPSRADLSTINRSTHGKHQAEPSGLAGDSV